MKNKCSEIKNYLFKKDLYALIHGYINAKVNIPKNQITLKSIWPTIMGTDISCDKLLFGWRMHSPASSLVIKTDIGRKIRFSEEKGIIAGEDRELLCRMAKLNINWLAYRIYLQFIILLTWMVNQ